IPALPLQHPVHPVPTALHVPAPPRNHVRVHVAHALPGVRAVLDRDVERRRGEHALQAPRHEAQRQEQVGGLARAQVAEPWRAPQRADQYVSREERLEVYEGEGERGEVEDLAAGE
ncbi:hypothetical protein FGG08_007565, partial [Glutinoglossum americanum]